MDLWQSRLHRFSRTLRPRQPLTFKETHMKRDTSFAAVDFVGRLLMATVFVPAGLQKLANTQGTAAYMATAGLPNVAAAAAAVGAFEVIMGIALVLGWRVRLAGLALAAFTLVATFLFHAFWKAGAPDQAMVQQLMFFKNIGIVGGLLCIATAGAAGWSIDARTAPLGTRKTA